MDALEVVEEILKTTDKLFLTKLDIIKQTKEKGISKKDAIEALEDMELKGKLNMRSLNFGKYQLKERYGSQ